MRSSSIARVAGHLTLLIGTRAAFAKTSSKNVTGLGQNEITVYWGQNSYGQTTGALAQQPLATYCDNPNIDIIPLAFLYQLTTGQGGQPVLDISAKNYNCSVFPGTSLMDCPALGQDIEYCQQKGKKILISIGGQTYLEGGFPSAERAIEAAKQIWATFGPPGANVSTDANITIASAAAVPASTVDVSYTSTSVSIAVDAPSPTFNNGQYDPSLYNTGQYDAAKYNPQAPPKAEIKAPQSSYVVPTGPAASPVPPVGSGASTGEADEGTVSVAIPVADLSDPAAPIPVTVSSQIYGPASSYNGASNARRQEAPSSTVLRPFGDATIDGFDFDFEAKVNNIIPFAQTLRALMDADTSRPYFLTAAPQCPYPDVGDQEVLDSDVKFDAIWVQFYNNACGLQAFSAATATNAAASTRSPNPGNSVIGIPKQSNAASDVSARSADGSYTDSSSGFNFATWDHWARTKSANQDVKIYLGIPADSSASSTGYVALADLNPIVTYVQNFSTFGGVMMWDATQAYANKGFLGGVRHTLGAAIRPADDESVAGGPRKHVGTPFKQQQQSSGDGSQGDDDGTNDGTVDATTGPGQATIGTSQGFIQARRVRKAARDLSVKARGLGKDDHLREHRAKSSTKVGGLQEGLPRMTREKTSRRETGVAVVWRG